MWSILICVKHFFFFFNLLILEAGKSGQWATLWDCANREHRMFSLWHQWCKQKLNVCIKHAEDIVDSWTMCGKGLVKPF